MLDPDGSEVDWFVGYGPPPEKYKDQIDLALRGVDTYKSLAAKYAKDPNDVATIFGLGRKQSRRYDQAKAAEFYNMVLALDPEGKRGTTDFEGEKVSFTQYAEFSMAYLALIGRPQSPAPFHEFVKKYPDGLMVREAYDRLSNYYYLRQAPKDDAAKFFAEFTGRFPKDPLALDAWMSRIIADQGPYELGIELGRKAIGLMAGTPRPRVTLNLAQIYLTSGNRAKAIETADLALTQAAGTEAAEGIAPTAATLYWRADAKDKALAAYGPAYAKEAWDSASLLVRYASFWSAQKGVNQESALQAAKRATELQPDLVPAWSALSDLHLTAKNFAEALKAAEKAYEIAAPGRMKESLQKKIDQIKKLSLEK
jgi:tetratricopeptide (TPR) repeat protein